METRDVHRLKEDMVTRSGAPVDLIETHISWVLLCREYVYKIKKPLKLSFLDFSSLEQRKLYCERELMLNQRLTKDMYLDVLSISQQGGSYTIGDDQENLVDYCLKMRRVDNDREMRMLLEKNLVNFSDMKMLAIQLSQFHRKAEVIKGAVSAGGLWGDFVDIRQVYSFMKKHLGQDSIERLDEMLRIVKTFIYNLEDRIKERDALGYIRDCHGDLHSGNIFLLKEPVIFDCIEFNDHFRQIDIINELAFLCMDLESFGRTDLSNYFLEEYISLHPVIQTEQDRDLLLFYKLYRSNVKVKVNAIKCMQTEDANVFDERILLLKKYFMLMMRYCDMLK